MLLQTADVPVKQWVMSTRFKRNEMGALVEESYFDEDGLPVLDNDGVHRVVYAVDGRGPPVSTNYYDRVGRPKRNGTAYTESSTFTMTLAIGLADPTTGFPTNR